MSEADIHLLVTFALRKEWHPIKRIVVLVVLAMAASSVALGQMAEDKSAPKGKVEQELIKLEKDRAQAAVRADTPFLEQNTADDYTFINPRGALTTKAQMLAAFKSRCESCRRCKSRTNWATWSMKKRSVRCRLESYLARDVP